MQISIYAGEGERPIRIHLPNVLLDFPFIWQLVGKSCKGLAESDTSSQSPKQMQNMARGLKRYVRKYDHFDLISVESATGERVIIRI